MSDGTAGEGETPKIEERTSGHLQCGVRVGDEVVLTDDIIEPANGDHPEFLLGKKNETVKILKRETIQGVYAYLVEGPTNPGKPWRAGVGDFTLKTP
jgi:hypothetical protein